jgi:hypothetical protein
VKVEWTEGKTQPRRKKEKRKKSDGSILLRENGGEREGELVGMERESNNRSVFGRKLSSTLDPRLPPSGNALISSCPLTTVIAGLTTRAYCMHVV